MVHFPLYLVLPITEQIREHIAADRLGAIVTPSSGKRVPDKGWRAVGTAHRPQLVMQTSDAGDQ